MALITAIIAARFSKMSWGVLSELAVFETKPRFNIILALFGPKYFALAGLHIVGFIFYPPHSPLMYVSTSNLQRSQRHETRISYSNSDQTASKSQMRCSIPP